MKISVVISLLFFALFSNAQDVVLENIRVAMSSGSSKELINFCGENVEIKIDGKSSNYSLKQAEVILKNFFMNNPVKSFEYIHQGASPEGLKYTIGALKLEEGNYRVVMMLKKQGQTYKIDQMNFSKE